MSENFEGHQGRECGEHRTTGQRAWCFDCTEWCYDHVPCKGCELPMLRNLIKRLDWPNIHTHYGYTTTCRDCDIYRQIAWEPGDPQDEAELQQWLKDNPRYDPASPLFGEAD